MRVSATAWIVFGLTFLAPRLVVAQLGFATTPKTATQQSATLKATSGSTLFSTSKTLPTGTSSSATGASRTAPGDVVAPMLGQDWAIQRTHEKGSFVGADSRDQQGFVGMSQASEGGTISSAASGLRVLTSNVNVPLPVRRNTEIYDPRVSLGFELARPAWEAFEFGRLDKKGLVFGQGDRLEAAVRHSERQDAQISDSRRQLVEKDLAERIQSSPVLQLKYPIAVSLEGETATLRGEVASERERALLEQRLLFEPGIYSVRNLLTVKSPQPQQVKP